MRIFLVLFILEGLLTNLFKGIVTQEALCTTWIVINSIYLLVWFYKKSDNKTMFYILTVGFLIRLLALIYDQNVAKLPFNNGDAIKFHQMAVMTASALPNEMLTTFTGFYSQVLGVIYYIFGEILYLAHFLNIVFIVLAATKLIDIANLLKIKTKNINIMIALWLFMPIPFLMGYALLREASIYYFIVLSVYYYLKWFEKYNPINILLSIVFIGVAALYHKGVFVIAAVYLYTYIFYNKKENKISINLINVIFIVAVVAIAFGYVSSESEKLLEQTNAETGGGSAYLTAVNVQSPIQFLLFAPIKGIYLLFSPMPWLIRGGLDIATFALDVSFWVLTVYTVFKNYKIVDTKFKMLILAVVAAGILFGMGTHNTGTAIRHRNKVFALVLITYIAVKDKKENEDFVLEGEAEDLITN